MRRFVPLAPPTVHYARATTASATLQGGDDKLPPPSPAADTTGSGVAPGFAVTGEEDHRQGDASTTEVGIDAGQGSSRPGTGGGGDKFGVRTNDHPHLAYIYRGRGSATDESGGGGGGGGGYPSAGGVDGKVAVGDEKPQDQVTTSIDRCHSCHRPCHRPCHSC